MIRNMEDEREKAAKNEDESSVVLTSIVIAEHDLDGTTGEYELGIIPQ